MTDESPEYDIFLSYARTDNRENDRYVEKLAQTLRSIYRAQTGRELRIFLDLDEIRTAEIWERRIRLALRRSAIMISVLSPAYFNSAWCGREWDAFTRMSQERSITYGITPYLKLIFPITLRRWTTDDQLSPDRRGRVRQAQALQYVDFADVSPVTRISPSSLVERSS
jgi:hypothetical protein